MAVDQGSIAGPVSHPNLPQAGGGEFELPDIPEQDDAGGLAPEGLRVWREISLVRFRRKVGKRHRETETVARIEFRSDDLKHARSKDPGFVQEILSPGGTHRNGQREQDMAEGETSLDAHGIVSEVETGLETDGLVQNPGNGKTAAARRSDSRVSCRLVPAVPTRSGNPAAKQL